MAYDPGNYDDYLRPVTSGWMDKIRLSMRRKKTFNEVAEQCMAFFSASTGFMWDDVFKTKFLKTQTSPRFRITIQKAFELVALYGPMLFWRNPQREIKPRRPMALPPLLQQMAEQDPQAQQFFQQLAQGQQLKDAQDDARSQIMELWLNYTPQEQPGGGLARHARRAVTEALVKGRGCLWVEPYMMPGSSKMLTGAFYDTVDNLFIDPDAESLDDAQWIARRVTRSIWWVEREYGLKKGALAGKGTHQSHESLGESKQDPDYDPKQSDGGTFDQIVYYKIWSKGGVGTRFSGNHQFDFKRAMELVSGDYVHIVVAEGVDWPLNLPSEKLPELTDDEIRQRLSWPVPYWKDDRWPVSVLDFYERPRDAWPIAPLAPGLGELTFLNVFISHLANRIWSSSRDFIAVDESSEDAVKRAIESGKDQAIIPLTETHQDVGKAVQFLQQPQTNFDAWRIVDRILDIFERRTGITELLSGMQQTQDRSAEATAVKREQMSIRPDDMSAAVEAWQTEVAILEKFCARWFIEPDDISGLLGPVGAYLWQSLVTTQDPELVVREMDATVQAGSSRKPNKNRDAQNINQLLPIVAPELSKHADVTTDTNPLNALWAKLGDAFEMDLSGLQMGPRMPPPPPPEQAQFEQQMAQMQMQMEQAKVQAEIMKAQADAASTQVKMQGDQVKQQGDQQKAQLDLQKMVMQAQIDQQKAQQETEARQADLMMEQQADLQSLFFDRLKSTQELSQDQEQHDQEITQDQEQHRQDVRQAREESRVKLKMAQKPSTNGAKK